MKKRTLLGLMAALPLSQLTACGSGNSGNDASVRLINASPGYSGLDFYVESTKKVSSVAFATASGFTDVSNGTVSTMVTSAGSTTSAQTISRSLSSGKSYSVVAYGWGGALQTALIAESEDAASSNETKFSVFNTTGDAGALDVYLTADTDELDSSTPVRSNVAGATRSLFSTVTSGTYRLRVTAYGDASDVRLDVSGVVLPSTGVMTLILTPTPGGVLVNGMLLQQGGSLTQHLNTKARARVISNVAAGAAVSMSVGSTVLASGAVSPSFKDYVQIDAGSVTFNGSVDGHSLVTTRDVKVGEDLTLLVTGASGAAASVMVVSDDNRFPTNSSKYKVRLVHGSNVLANAPLTLTINSSDVVVEQVYGSVSGYELRDASTDTGAGLSVSVPSTGAVILNLDSQVINAKGVYSVFIYDTVAGDTIGRLKKER